MTLRCVSWTPLGGAGRTEDHCDAVVNRLGGTAEEFRVGRSVDERVKGRPKLYDLANESVATGDGQDFVVADRIGENDARFGQLDGMVKFACEQV